MIPTADAQAPNFRRGDFAYFSPRHPTAS
jgi:hypothetical protein